MSIGDVNSSARGSGARYNDGKVALDLIPGIALEDCARVFDYGRKKYAAWNWAKGMQWMVPFGCLLRHMYAWARGEDNDPESGLPHLGHAMCNLVMLATFARTYPEGDDRPKGLFEFSASRAIDSVSMDGPPNLGTTVPNDNAYLASFSPNERLHGYGIGDAEPATLRGIPDSFTDTHGTRYSRVHVADPLHLAKTTATPQHVMAAEAIRDHDERLHGPEDAL